MNVRKPIDYSIMFAALEALMAADLPQMELQQKIAASAHLEISLDFTVGCAILGKRTALWSVSPMTKILFICHGSTHPNLKNA